MARLVPVDYDPFALPPPQIGGAEDFVANYLNNLAGGVQAGADLLTGNFETPFNPKQTPRTQALGDKLFPEGSDGSLLDAMRNLPQTELKDWSGALLEKFGATPAGKALSAIGGVVPSFNLAGSAYQTFARPAILKTGVEPENLDAGMLLGGAALGARQLAKPKPALPQKAVADTAAQLKKIGVTPDQVIRTMEDARKQGVNLTVPEASAKLTQSPTGAPYATGNTLINRQRVIEQSSLPAADIIGQAKAGRQGQIVDVLSQQAKGIMRRSDDIARPLYEAVKEVQIPKAKFRELLKDPVIADVVSEMRGNKSLYYKLSAEKPYSVGFMNEVKKFIDSKKDSISTDRYLGGLYGDATRKITGAIDDIVPEYAQARAASRPGIVAREGILKPLESSDSLGVIKNRIFASPEKRAELQRGLGDTNFKNLSDLVNIIERTQKTALGGSDTFTKAQTAAEMGSSLGGKADIAMGGKIGVIKAGVDWLAGKVDEKNYADLAKVYTTKDISALKSELSAAYNKAPSGSINALYKFFTERLPADVLKKGAPSNVAIRSQDMKGSEPRLVPVDYDPFAGDVQTPPVTLPGASEPSTMDVTPLEALPGGGQFEDAPSDAEVGPLTAIEGTINAAAQATGVDPSLLRAIAMTESSLNPQARAKTSSAAGLFQITKPTFRTLAKKYGQQYGITMRDVMNPEANALMAAHLTAENADALGRALGREVTPGESYIAHFMGATGAAMLLKADPNKPAARLFPQAAKANRSIFFDGRRPRTNGELAYLLASKVERRMPDDMRREPLLPAPMPSEEPSIDMAALGR